MKELYLKVVLSRAFVWFTKSLFLRKILAVLVESAIMGFFLFLRLIFQSSDIIGDHIHKIVSVDTHTFYDFEGVPIKKRWPKSSND